MYFLWPLPPATQPLFHVLHFGVYRSPILSEPFCFVPFLSAPQGLPSGSCADLFSFWLMAKAVFHYFCPVALTAAICSEVAWEVLAGMVNNVEKCGRACIHLLLMSQEDLQHTRFCLSVCQEHYVVPTRFNLPEETLFFFFIKSWCKFSHAPTCIRA